MKISLKSFVLLACSYTLLVTGCSSKDPNEPTEVKPKSEQLYSSDAPPDVLLDSAQALYLSGLYSVARDSFQSLYSTYPMGPYVELAKIKAADCSFLMGEYEIAASSYENFLKDHPGHSSRDYATFRAGLSHYLNNKGVGRDVTPLEQALKFFEKTQSDFPDSAFAKSANFYQTETEKKIASYNQEVLKFYAARGNEKAYTKRLAEFDDKWAAVIDSENKWPEQNDSLMLANLSSATALTPLPEINNIANDMSSRAGFRAVPVRLSGQVQLESIKCRSNDLPSITMFFDNSQLTLATLESFANKNTSLDPEQGIIKLNIPGLGADVRTYSCFTSNDVSIEQSGVIIVNSNMSLQVMQLENPARLMLLPQQ